MTYATFPVSGGGGGGSGDVQGPGSAVNNGVVLFNGTSGKIIKDGGVGSANQVLVSDGTTPSFAQIVNANISTGAAIDLNKLATVTADRALVSNGSGVIAASSVTATELGYLSGVTSGIQAQIDGKLSLTGGTLTGNLTVSASNAQVQILSSTATAQLRIESSSRIWLIQNTSNNLVFRDGTATSNRAQLDTFGSFSIFATSNQLVLGTTNTTTISATAPAASRVYTMPDVGGNADFVMTDGAQTIVGVKTYSSTIVGDISGNAGTVTNGAYVNSANTFTLAQTISAASNQLVLSSGVNQLTLNSGTSAAARTYTVPDVGTTANFVMTAGAQTIADAKTFSDDLTVGSNALFVDVSTGNVGIGTASPNNVLDVVTASADGSSSTHGMRIGTAGNRKLNLGGNDANNTFWMQTFAGYTLHLQPQSGAVTLGPSSGGVDHKINGNLGIGKDFEGTLTTTTPGVSVFDGGSVFIVRNNTLLQMNRLTTDGTLVSFAQDGTTEGSISVSGTTVSYNGAHLSRWSQFNDKSTPEILRGTVLSSTGQMASWEEEENEQLTCSKVSNIVGDTTVSGVFDRYDQDDNEQNPQDFYVAQSGDFVIRIAAGVTVQVGDLLESAGDGTAKPQADNLVKSSTIAKVMSAIPSVTYEDGSYCAPCLLMLC